MATIIQINRIATNRSGAVTDTVNRLESTNTADEISIRAQHLPLDDSQFTITAAGLIQPNPTTINLSDVQSYTTTTLRNDADDIVWHVGDVAVVTGPTNIPGSTTFAATTGNTNPIPPYTGTAFQYSAFVGTMSFRINGGWDIAAGAPAAGLGISTDGTSMIQFRSSSDPSVIRGTTTGGTDFRVTSIVQQGSNANAIVTVDRSTLPAVTSPSPEVGDLIYIGTTSQPTTIPANTYIYTCTDQTTAGTTMDGDWTVLRTPTASESGTLPTTKTAQTASISTSTTGVTVASTNVSFANTLFTYTAGDTGTPTFPTAAGTVLEIYVDGLKISSNEVNNITGTSFTLIGAESALMASGNFVVEVVWRD